MDLNEWRKQQSDGEDAELPSGLTVQLKRVGVLDLASQGGIPQELRPKLEGMMDQGGAGVARVGLDDFQEFAPVVDLVCRASIVGPAGLEVDELPYADRLAIFNWANEVATPLKTFRPETAQPVGTAFDIGHVRNSAEPGAGLSVG